MQRTVTFDDKLVRQAHEVTGIDELSALLDHALKQLLHHEASRRLALLGGSDPDLKDIPRKRFW